MPSPFSSHLPPLMEFLTDCYALKTRLFSRVSLKKRKAAIATAQAGGVADDVKALNDALAGTPLSLSGNFDLTGNWACRIIKLGGLTKLVVYPQVSLQRVG